eukprot:CAMPEP_0173086704 /NCGR_PEP_ID=MMETSP1102-20130122/23089_1 /TAXON_ID=49646 /ORGANISM="Geminigera sp., Strain Caron Lab Isolate" /LENGTH=92 /DNA_ID=CAMNT_0013967651 /DNA_START=87 /DNA_END=365 /DNA_ORIENTATION=+
MTGSMNAWKLVLDCSEALSGDSEVIQGKIATFENLALTCEVLGHLDQAAVFAEKARQLQHNSDVEAEEVGSKLKQSVTAQRDCKKSATCVCS